MIINIRTLLRLPVYTESGIKLGSVFDLELDVKSGSVLRYLVKPNFFSLRYFLVGCDQVKEVKVDRVVVYDSVTKDNAQQASGAMALEE